MVVSLADRSRLRREKEGGERKRVRKETKCICHPKHDLICNLTVISCVELLKLTRKFMDGIYEMMASIHIDAWLMQDERHVQYRYMVVDPRKGKHYEDLHDYGNTVVNRCFRMSREECAEVQSSTEGNKHKNNEYL